MIKELLTKPVYQFNLINWIEIILIIFLIEIAIEIVREMKK